MATEIKLEGYKRAPCSICRIPYVLIEHTEDGGPDEGLITITLPNNIVSIVKVSPEIKKTKIDEVKIVDVNGDLITKVNIGVIKGKDPGDVVDTIAKLLNDPTPAIETDRWSYDRDGFFRLHRRYYHGPISELAKRREKDAKRLVRDSTSEPDINIQCVRVSSTEDECLSAICTAISIMYDHPSVMWNKYKNPHHYYPYRAKAGLVIKLSKVLEVASSHGMGEVIQEHIIDEVSRAIEGEEIDDDDDFF